jgi:hypothetical protein
LADFDKSILNRRRSVQDGAGNRSYARGLRQRWLAPLEQDKDVDPLCAILEEVDGKEHVFSAALQMINAAAETKIVISFLRSSS